MSVSSSSGLGCPDFVLAGIGERYAQTGSPRGITTVHPIAAGDMYGIDGIDHLAQPGLLKRVIAGSYPSGPSSMPSPKIWQMIAENQVEVLKTARLRYKITTGGSTQMVDATNILHIPGPMSDDGYTGRSVIGTFRETLGLGLALERYGAEFFANAATPKGTLTTEPSPSGIFASFARNFAKAWV